EPNLLEDRVRLVAPSFLDLLGLLVLELAVVHDLHPGRDGVRANLDQVQPGFLRQTQGVLDADDADLFSRGAHQADLGHADPVVRSGIADVGSFRYRTRRKHPHDPGVSKTPRTALHPDYRSSRATDG